MQGIHLFTRTESGNWTQVKSKSDSFQHLSDVSEIVSEVGRREAPAIISYNCNYYIIIIIPALLLLSFQHL